MLWSIRNNFRTSRLVSIHRSKYVAGYNYFTTIKNQLGKLPSTLETEIKPKLSK